MSDYIVKTIDTKHFSLTQNELPLGDLKYKSRFSFKAEVNLADASAYKFEPKGFWGNTIELKDRYRTVLYFKQNWKGKIIINALFENYNRQFTLKQKGVFKSGYVLCDVNDRVLLDVTANFKWKKFNYDYILSVNPELDKLEYRHILLLTSIYCINYYLRRNASMITS
jgi:hypothetical protein